MRYRHAVIVHHLLTVGFGLSGIRAALAFVGFALGAAALAAGAGWPCRIIDLVRLKISELQIAAATEQETGKKSKATDRFRHDAPTHGLSPWLWK